MRSVGLSFQVYLSKTVGAAGIGLFMLTMTVSIFAVTFAVSGSRFAVTRLVSEEIGRGGGQGAACAVRCGLCYAAVFGVAALFFLNIAAEPVAEYILMDKRAKIPLQIYSMGMPSLALSAVFSGYFTAVGRVLKASCAQLLEQAVQIVFVILVFSSSGNREMGFACSVIMMGAVLGDVASFAALLVLYIHDKREYLQAGSKPKRGMLQRLTGIAFPLALSAYARTVLLSLQNLLVPRGLRKFGATSDGALADYGTIQGMVFPIITFPSALFSAVSELMVPELTHAQVAGDRKAIKRTVDRMLRLCMYFSFCVCGVLLAYANEFGEVIYPGENVGRYIKALALLMPVMYLDTVTDGMLRGLGQHMYSMKINIIDALLSAGLVFLLVPKFAVAGYIFVLYFSEVFNFVLSVVKLKNSADFMPRLRSAAVPAMCVFAAINVTSVLMRSVLGISAGPAVMLLMRVFITTFCYCLLLRLLIPQSDEKKT